ncbi:MAG: HEPN domain-containing protein [Chlamydiota bacterium]
MAATVIDVMYQDFSALIAILDQAGEVSLRSMIDSTFKKTLALSAASFFEDEIRRILLALFADRSANDALLSNFLRNKAIERQYHSFFQWRSNNANSFFGLFGEDFKDSASQDVKQDPALAEAVKAFLALGNTRNELAHLNFASFALDATAEEVYRQYQTSFTFVSYLEKKLTSYGKIGEPAGPQHPEPAVRLPGR